jgi:hypothetical protein
MSKPDCITRRQLTLMVMEAMGWFDIYMSSSGNYADARHPVFSPESRSRVVDYLSGDGMVGILSKVPMRITPIEHERWAAEIPGTGFFAYHPELPVAVALTYLQAKTGQRYEV